MNRVIFNKIVVIQSLKDGEHHTGTKIHEDIDLYNAVFNRRLELDLLDVERKSDLISVFDSLTNQARNSGIFPVVHIESHGSDDTTGLILSSGDFVSWNEFREMATRLNVATRLNLLIVLAACHGANFTRELIPSDRAPCWGLVGPTKAVTSSNLLRSFTAFYQEMFRSGSGGKSVENLNANCEKGDIEYYFAIAEHFFSRTYKNYIANLCTEKAYDQRARDIRKKLKKEKSLKIPSVGHIKRYFKNSQETKFNEFREKFFMTDLYQENNTRFVVKYKDVIDTINP